PGGYSALCYTNPYPYPYFPFTRLGSSGHSVISQLNLTSFMGRPTIGHFKPRGVDVMNKAFDISRRRLLLSLPALVMAPRAFVQTANPPIRARGINHVTLDVSDVKRAVDFYQGLFGMPVIN